MSAASFRYCGGGGGFRASALLTSLSFSRLYWRRRFKLGKDMLLLLVYSLLYVISIPSSKSKGNISFFYSTNTYSFPFHRFLPCTLRDDSFMCSPSHWEWNKCVFNTFHVFFTVQCFVSRRTRTTNVWFCGILSSLKYYENSLWKDEL